jgi:integrase
MLNIPNGVKSQAVRLPGLRKASLPGVTPHTLRHTIGSTAISTGKAMALTGAILGHSNPRSTAVYAHIQHEPSGKAASRVSKKIAAALFASSLPKRFAFA